MNTSTLVYQVVLQSPAGPTHSDIESQTQRPTVAGGVHALFCQMN